MSFRFKRFFAPYGESGPGTAWLFRFASFGDSIHDHYPLAYPIAFGTYGTRLHGDDRGTVDQRMNQPGEAIIGTQPDWEWIEFNRLRFPPR